LCLCCCCCNHFDVMFYAIKSGCQNPIALHSWSSSFDGMNELVIWYCVDQGEL
jgi:hypothetical protein